MKSKGSEIYVSRIKSESAGTVLVTVASTFPVGNNPNCFCKGNSNIESLK